MTARKSPHNRVQHRKPSPRRDERQQLRTGNPDLRPANAKPSLGHVTVSEIDDATLGLETDAVAQRDAEMAIKAASSSWVDATPRPAKAFRPVAIHIATGADDEDEAGIVPDVVETMTPERGRFDQ